MSRTLDAAVTAVLLLVVAAGCQSAPTPAPPSVDAVTITIPIVIQDKAVISAAADVLSARLRSLGYETFSVAIGESIVFTLPADPPPDEAKIRSAFGQRGSLTFVPLPIEAGAPATGARAPAGVPPLFDPADEVVSAMVTESLGQEQPALQIDLGPIGTKAVAIYSVAHLGDYLIVVLDGSVLASPAVMSSIQDGQLQLSMASTDSLLLPLDVAAAVIDSGPLPAGWP